MLALDRCESRGSVGHSQQSWISQGGRLWQGTTDNLVGDPEGDLRLQPCNMSRPGQHWKLSSTPGSSTQTNVKNSLPFRDGGCWEITACETGDVAEVGVNFGCKPLPGNNWSNPCDANGAWSFNANSTITSVMDGKCLQVDPRNNMIVNVATCNAEPSQQWNTNGSAVESAGMPGFCVDSGVASPPPGTTGQCVAVDVTNDVGGAGSWEGLQGPALKLASGQDCDPSRRPGPTQTISFGTVGGFHAGALCAAVRHGRPSPFGPLQLWAKPQPGGAVAIALLNRASTGSPTVMVDVPLKDLPGLPLRKRVLVRDIWERHDLLPVEGIALSVSVQGGDSRLLLLKPAPVSFTEFI